MKPCRIVICLTAGMLPNAPEPNGNVIQQIISESCRHILIEISRQCIVMDVMDALVVINDHLAVSLGWFACQTAINNSTVMSQIDIKHHLQPKSV